MITPCNNSAVSSGAIQVRKNLLVSSLKPVQRNCIVNFEKLCVEATLLMSILPKNEENSILFNLLSNKLYFFHG